MLSKAAFLTTLAIIAASALSEKPLTYVQVQCHDAKCSVFCNGGPIPQDTCIDAGAGT